MYILTGSCIVCRCASFANNLTIIQYSLLNEPKLMMNVIVVVKTIYYYSNYNKIQKKWFLLSQWRRFLSFIHLYQAEFQWLKTMSCDNGFCCCVDHIMFFNSIHFPSPTKWIWKLMTGFNEKSAHFASCINTHLIDNIWASLSQQFEEQFSGWVFALFTNKLPLWIEWFVEICVSSLMATVHI